MPKRFGLVIDQERCIGCEACSVACIIENNPATGPFIRVQTIGGESKDTPKGRYQELKMEFLPRLCMHCDSPPCAKACPNHAIKKRPDGLVILYSEECNGCQLCIDACPYDAISYSADSGLVEKCNFCFHRIDKGLEPFCVICCQGQAMYFCDLNDSNSKIVHLLARRSTYKLKPELNTGPAVIYCRSNEARRL